MSPLICGKVWAMTGGKTGDRRQKIWRKVTKRDAARSFTVTESRKFRKADGSLEAGLGKPIAPRTTVFISAQWNTIGTKKDLLKLLTIITRIDTAVLESGDADDLGGLPTNNSH